MSKTDKLLDQHCINTGSTHCVDIAKQTSCWINTVLIQQLSTAKELFCKQEKNAEGEREKMSPAELSNREAGAGEEALGLPSPCDGLYLRCRCLHRLSGQSSGTNPQVLNSYCRNIQYKEITVHFTMPLGLSNLYDAELTKFVPQKIPFRHTIFVGTNLKLNTRVRSTGAVPRSQLF